MKKIRNLMKSQAGFTLIELLIVIVILGTLAAIIIPRMTNLTEEARVSAGESSLRSVYNGLEMYKVKHGNHPATDTDTGIVLEDTTTDPDTPGIDTYIENFTDLDTFLGEWNYSSYSPDAASDATLLEIIHSEDTDLILYLLGNGTVTDVAPTTSGT